MSRSLSRPAPRSWSRQFFAALVLLLGTASSAFAQSPGCQITATWPTWTGGNGFGASLDIRNTGPAINGWSLVFTMPNGQRVQNGWPVSFTQAAGSSTVTVASNASWNASIPTNGVFNVAFNGTHTGTNTAPTGYTLNGVACTAPGGNTAPTVQITAPANGATVSGTAVALSATATDNSGVARVEFRIDNGAVTSDTTAPYGITFNASGLSAGTHTATATAFDNGNPSLSATHTITFTVQGGGNTAPTVAINSPSNGQIFPAGTTSVPVTATATDPGGAVVRVEFRRGTTLIATDTSSPYSATITGLTAGSNTISAQAFDNGSPSLSATASVTITVGTAPTPTVSATPTSLTIPGGQSLTSTIRLSAAPTASTAVTIARTSGSTDIGPATQTVTLTTANWNTGLPATFTAAAGTTAASATFTASATGHTPVTILVSRSSGGNALFRVNSTGRITKNGTLFPVRCGSWFGLEGRHEPPTDSTNPGGAPMEQYIGNTFWANGGAGTGRTIAQTMSEIAGMGINVIRLPLVPQTLSTNDPQGTGSVLKNHPSVRIANSRLALETMIRAADAANIEIMLDVHSCSNYVGWRKGRLDARPPWTDATRDNYEFKREDSSCAATGNPAGVTRIQAYNTSMWLDNLRTLAGMSASLGVDNIIGIDIFNEPHDYTWAEWKSLTEQAYSAINTVNPNLLLFVQGIGTNAGAQDGTPATVTVQPHGVEATNPNWGENLFEAVSNPINVPKSQLVWSPHTYGPSVFVQRMFMDPAQTQCAGLEGDAAGDANCNIVINPTLLRQGWEEHFGFLKQQNFAIVVGEFGGNLDWPGGQAAVRDRDRWSHITPGVDGQWQNAFVDYMVEKQIEGCYWSINPESGDTAGWYGHAYDPVSNTAGWGQWLGFDARKTALLNRLWGR